MLRRLKCYYHTNALTIVAAALSCALAVIAALLPSSIPDPETHPWTEQERLLLLALTVTTTLPALSAWVRHKLDVFEPVYFISLLTLVYFVGVPIVLAYEDRFVNGNIDYRPQLAGCLAITLVSILSYYAGYYAGKLSLQQGLDWLTGLQPDRVRRYAFLGIILAISLFCVWIWINRLPLWVLNVFDDRASYGYQHRLSSIKIGYLSAAHYSLVPFLLLAVAYRSEKRPGLLWVILWVGTAVFYMASGNRSRVILLFLGTFVYFMLETEKRPRGMHVLILAVIMFWFNGFVGSNRLQRSQGVELVGIKDIAEAFLSGNSIILGLAMVVKVFPTYVPFQIGKILMAVLTLPVPRILWAGKPVNQLYSFIEMFVSPQYVRTPPFFGTFYADFGIPGVMVGMVVLGLGCAYVYRLWQLHPDSPSARVLLALTIPVLLTVYLRNLNQGLSRLFLVITPVLIVALVARRK